MLHTDHFITVYVLVVSAILGSVFGSFLNCMAWRIVNKESIWKGRSHCAVCGHYLSAIDLIPIFSYIFRKGKCGYCKEKIAPRYFIVELIMAAIFAGIVWRYDISFLALRYLVLSCILMALSLVDLDIYEIPNRFIISGIVWWFVTIPFMETAPIKQLTVGLSGAIALGGSVLLFSLFMDYILKKESMGGGDIKLLFMLGLYMGPVLGLFHIIVSCLTGLVFIAILKKNTIPFGPAISLSALVMFLWGNDIVTWYLQLFV